jgi:hypothetical protein
MYWINLWREISIWREIKKVTRQNADVLKEKNLRVDWIGRIYTVFNLPQEVIETPSTREPYLTSQLREVDDVLLNLGLSDLVYPEFNQIEGTDSYLLVLYADTDYLNIGRFLLNVLIWGGSIWIGIALIRWAYTIPSVHQAFLGVSKFL